MVAMPFYEGDRVRKGELLVEIDGKLLAAQLQRVKAQRKQAEKELNRVRGLINRNLVSRTELTGRETDLAIARADEKLMATRLEYTRIRSPISGIVSERLSEPGNIAEDYTHLMSIVDLSALLIEVTVSELFLNRLQNGQPVDIQIDALAPGEAGEGYPFTGTITRIHPLVDSSTRKGTVEITLNPTPEGARPGQFARVRFKVTGSESLLIPYASLRKSPGDQFVYLVTQDNRIEQRPVTTGLRFGESIEILSGLVAGDQVVTRGFTNLKEGMSVQISPVVD